MVQVMSRFGTYAGVRRLALSLAVALAFVAAPLPHARAYALPGTVMQLAEVLGAVHHLRTLCGTNEGQLWRNKMIEMMGAIDPSEMERKALIKRFNDAYYRYRNAYPNCTGTAAGQSDKLMQDGQRLAAELAANSARR